MSEKEMPTSLAKHLQDVHERWQEVCGNPSPAEECCVGIPRLCNCLGKAIPGCLLVKKQLTGSGATTSPSTCPSQSLLDLLTTTVLAAQSKSALRAALGLLLQELNRRDSPSYADLNRIPALLAEQCSPFTPNFTPCAQFTSAEAAIAQGLDPSEVLKKGDGGRAGATASVLVNSPPEVTNITPPDVVLCHIQTSNETLQNLAATSAGIVTLPGTSDGTV